MKNNITLGKNGFSNQNHKFSFSTAMLLNFLFALIFVLFINLDAISQNYRIISSGPSVANPGGKIEYVIAVKNSGTYTPDMVITFNLPSVNMYTYLNSKPAGKFNKENNTVVWDASNNSEIASFENREIILSVSVKAGAISNGKYKMPSELNKLSAYASMSSVKLNISLKSNEVNTEVPNSGGAVLPVE